VDVYTGRTCPCTTVTGVGVFQKKVILYGSEGNVKVFSSEYREDDCDAQELPTRNLPRCVVHVAEPVVLSARIAEPCSCGCCDCDCGCGCGCGCGCIPAHICNRYGGNFCDNADSRNIYVTLGIFTIVQLIRNVQMLVPVYDFCMPSKECSCPATDSPCDLFRKMSFPVDEFFPPKESHGDCGCACSAAVRTRTTDPDENKSATNPRGGAGYPAPPWFFLRPEEWAADTAGGMGAQPHRVDAFRMHSHPAAGALRKTGDGRRPAASAVMAAQSKEPPDGVPLRRLSRFR